MKTAAELFAEAKQRITEVSPEQVRRPKEVDQRSDLWSLGVIVFRAHTGQLPFPGDEIGDVLAKICGDPIPLDQPIDLFFSRVTSAAGANQSFGFESEAFNDSRGVEISVRQEESFFGKVPRRVS